MVLSEESKVVVSADQVSCDLAGEAAILNLKNGVYYGLDEIGARVWKLIQQPRTLAEIRDCLLSEYEVEPARLESDLRDLLSNLLEHSLVEVGTAA